MIKLGKKLRDLRKAKGYSQDNIAIALNLSQGYYSKLETDEDFPSEEVVQKIAAYYDITPQELFAGDGQTQIQYNHNHDSAHSVNAFMVWQDPQKLVEELLATKEKIIALQAKQIELLEGQVHELKARQG